MNEIPICGFARILDVRHSYTEFRRGLMTLVLAFGPPSK